MSSNPQPPVLIAVAPNGARKSQRDHSKLPISPAELAACARDCRDAGAAMLHLHVRDAAGRHSLAPADYRMAIDAIRGAVGDEVLLQITTEAGGRYAPDEQMACAEAVDAEAVSLAVRELFANPADESRVAAFLARLAERGTFVQYIVYDAKDLARFVGLHASGRVPQARPSVLLVLGSYAEQRAGTPREMLPLLAALPQGWPWAVCAFGVHELACVTASALLGGHVRVGFENNTQLPSGEIAADNATLVQRAVATLAQLGLRPATGHEARELLRA